MAESNKEEKQAKRPRVRSPKYPYIALSSAIDRAQQFYDHERRSEANVSVAVKHWGYNEKSSGGVQTIAALKAFGLMEYGGAGKTRTVKLTERSLRILLDERPDGTDRRRLLVEAALEPPIHKALWGKYGGNFPSDVQLRHMLIFDWQPPFNENSVDAFISEFRSTLEFAGVGDDDNMPFINTDDEPSPPEEAADPAPKTGEIRRRLEGRVGMNNDVYTLPEGDVVIQWPKTLTKASHEEVVAWLNLILKKLNRSVAPDMITNETEKNA